MNRLPTRPFFLPLVLLCQWAGSVVAASSSRVVIASADDPALDDIGVWHPWHRTEPLGIDAPVLANNSKLLLQFDIARQSKPAAPPAGFGNLQQVRG